MEQLIWFSMPGAFVVIALAFVCPDVVGTTEKAALLIVLIPVIGFFVHQAFRLLFELSDGFKIRPQSGGFKRRSRIALDYIINNLGPKEGIENMDRENAFLVWEITFYGEKFPKAFRDHNRVTWHYILSFWSTSFASFIGFLIVLYGIFPAPIEVSLAAVLIIEVIAVATFYLKGKSTQNSLYS